MGLDLSFVKTKARVLIELIFSFQFVEEIISELS